MLDCLGTRELPVPESFEIYHLRHEAAASDKTAVEVVMEDLEQRRIRLEAEAEELSVQDDPHVPEQLDYLYEQLDELDADKALAKASLILHGLGFDAKMQNTVRFIVLQVFFHPPHCRCRPQRTSLVDGACAFRSLRRCSCSPLCCFSTSPLITCMCLLLSSLLK